MDFVGPLDLMPNEIFDWTERKKLELRSGNECRFPRGLACSESAEINKWAGTWRKKPSYCQSCGGWRVKRLLHLKFIQTPVR